MLITLTILIIAVLLAGALAAFTRIPALVARLTVLIGLVAGLAVHLYFESFDGGGVVGQSVDVPSFAPWLGAPVFRTDTLSAGLGAWCLLLAALLVAARLPGNGQGASWRVVLFGSAATVLYGLVHTFSLLALGIEMLLLVVAVWTLALIDDESAQGQSTKRGLDVGNSHSVMALGLGALSILGAALVTGRTTGGQYSLMDLSLSGIAGWPLILIAAGTALWLGLAPFMAWSGRVSRGHAGLVQSLVIMVPVAALLLRVQALISAQGLAGSVPGGWAIFTAGLAWLGAITGIAAGASTILWAGTTRWSAPLTACMGGLICWSLGLDNPAGRQAAVALLLAFGAGRVTLELIERSSFGGPAIAAGDLQRVYLPAARGIALFSLAAVPLTTGFVGLWLLSVAVVQTRHAAYVMALAAAAILAACGAGLHMANRSQGENAQADEKNSLAGWLGISGSLLLLVGGIAPALWLPEATNISSVAGGTPPVTPGWMGIGSPVGVAPLLLMGLAAIVLAIVSWLLRAALRAGVSDAGLLLPAAMSRVRTAPGSQSSGLLPAGIGPQSAPAPVWWLSLQWVEEGVWGFGVLLVRLGTRLGIGMERLETRYYLPLALILVLAALFAITR